jgi:hypothetical protein
VKPAPHSVPPLSVLLKIHLHLLSARVASEKAAAIRPASIYFVLTLSRTGASISVRAPGGRVSKLGRECAWWLACVCSEEELLTSETTSVSQHFEVQLPAVFASTMGSPPANNFCNNAPILQDRRNGRRDFHAPKLLCQMQGPAINRGPRRDAGRPRGVEPASREP